MQNTPLIYNFRNSITDIENISTPTQSGYIPLGEMARIEEFWSPPNVGRERRERIVKVSITPYKVSLGEMANMVKAEITDLDKVKKMDAINHEIGIRTFVWNVEKAV